MLRIYGLGGWIELRDLKRESCLRSDNQNSECFNKHVIWRLGCCVTIVVQYIYMDGVVREGNERAYSKDVKL